MIDPYVKMFEQATLFLIGVGTVIYLFYSKGKILVTIWTQIKKLIGSDDEFIDPQISNYKTIVEYLYNKNRDIYMTAFKYIPQHSRLPNDIVLALTKIILNKKPFSKYGWINLEERLRVTRYLCLILIKNHAAKEQTSIQKLNINLCEPLKNIVES